ncbi:hypothetical protein NL676_039803 [Syzygium grande]|nr:hypothetical protein NL676_039803 [Syzygium grande]
MAGELVRLRLALVSVTATEAGWLELRWRQLTTADGVFRASGDLWGVKLDMAGRRVRRAGASLSRKQYSGECRWWPWRCKETDSPASREPSEAGELMGWAEAASVGGLVASRSSHAQGRGERQRSGGCRVTQ